MPPVKKPFDIWREDLKAAKYIVAPMVDQSELAWRLLNRRYGAELCYTPMFHASLFVRNATYRKENFTSCEEDRPLVVQFCANDADVFLKAATLVQGKCDAVDLNLGCPQTIARKGHYGAFLQDEWDLVYKMVNLVHSKLDVPIFCKIRVFESIEKTVQYAKMLESAGCQLLTVHGRTREQKGPQTGVASWAHIRAVKENVTIPVFANGNIQYLNDVERCLQETNVEGVMIAEGSLHNPALFHGLSPPVWTMAEEYLDIVKKHPAPLSYVRGHLFKLFQHCLALKEHVDLREELAKAGNIDIFLDVTIKLKERFSNAESRETVQLESNTLSCPPWICQPYVRPSPSANQDCAKSRNADSGVQAAQKRSGEGLENGLSKKKIKKLQRNPKKVFQKQGKDFQICTSCPNPKGSKCAHELCKGCCKKKCSKENLDCAGHKLHYHQKRNVVNETVASKNLVTEKLNSITNIDKVLEFG